MTQLLTTEVCILVSNRNERIIATILCLFYLRISINLPCRFFFFNQPDQPSRECLASLLYSSKIWSICHGQFLHMSTSHVRGLTLAVWHHLDDKCKTCVQSVTHRMSRSPLTIVDCSQGSVHAHQSQKQNFRTRHLDAGDWRPEERKVLSVLSVPAVCPGLIFG